MIDRASVSFDLPEEDNKEEDPNRMGEENATVESAKSNFKDI